MNILPFTSVFEDLVRKAGVLCRWVTFSEEVLADYPISTGVRQSHKDKYSLLELLSITWAAFLSWTWAKPGHSWTGYILCISGNAGAREHGRCPKAWGPCCQAYVELECIEITGMLYLSIGRAVAISMRGRRGHVKPMLRFKFFFWKWYCIWRRRNKSSA